MKAATVAGAIVLLMATACGEAGSMASGAGGSPGGIPGPGGMGATASAGGAGGSGGITSTGGTGGAGGTGGSTVTNVNCASPEGPEGALKLTEIATGLTYPMMVTFAPGDDARLYVAERAGVIKLIKNGGPPEVFLDISDKVISTGGERGLYGIAVHPDYVNNGRFWVHYATEGGDDHLGVVQEYRRHPNSPDAADPDPVHPPTMVVNHFAANHNGGSIEFNPFDGLLYIGMGDGGSGYDPYNNGVNKGSVLGALLRIDVSPTDGSYSSPSGNAPGGAPEVFDWGLRNPYRFSFDLCTGDRYIGDVGQINWEEVDIAPMTQGPTNWGWDCREGAHPLEPLGAAGPAPGCPFGDEVDPAWEYPHVGSLGWAVIGGNVYRGNAIPWLRGSYIFGDFNGVLWRTRWTGQAIAPSDVVEVNNLGVAIVGFGQDNRGEVYVAWSGGIVYRLDPE